jgi:hypothetical protein
MVTADAGAAAAERELLQTAVCGLASRSPELSAATGLPGWQKGTLAGLAVTVGGGAVLAPEPTLVALLAVMAVPFLLVVALRAVALWHLLAERPPPRALNAPLIDGGALPLYTVLVPLYRESAVVPHLLGALARLDYPVAKLEVLLIVERVDVETRGALRRAALPPHMRVVVVPDGRPRTKPRACQYALQFAHGDYVVVYDAEDVPEPDQLKKAVVMFRKGGEEFICYQGALNYFNKDENILTKLFTLEYSYWYDYLLPGLDRLKLVIPLGGTSNHFDTEKLKGLGGWDPFNTTEDADLGVRAFAEGYKVGVLNSTTFEEANSRLGNFIRQRSRWIKGYMQTWLVYSRHPIKLMRVVGFKGWVSFNLFIGGTPFVSLVNPITWSVFFVWILTRTKIIEPLFPPEVLYISMFNLLFGNFLGIYLNMVAIFKRKYYTLVPFAFLNPLYWWLQSVAAYKSIYQLFRNPFYWEKTQHGITKHKVEQKIG